MAKARMEFSSAFRIKRDGLRPVVRTTAEALRFIDEELPIELQGLPRWTFARDLLLAADKSNKKRDMTVAARQFKQALSNEGWLAQDVSLETTT
jgi:hypothetical protein